VKDTSKAGPAKRRPVRARHEYFFASAHRSKAPRSGSSKAVPVG
jgi:hypothetical protein